jgi:hypothetical protein
LPGDVTIAPSSSTTDNPAVKSLYIVARGVDNDADPTENDGKMYEMTVAFTYSPTIPPTPGPTATSAPPTSFPTPQPVPGDANGDRLVNEADYAVWKTNYNQSVPIGDFARGDFSDPIVRADGKVNGLDYTVWFNHFTASSPTNTPVPTIVPTNTPRPSVTLTHNITPIPTSLLQAMDSKSTVDREI